LRKIDKCVYNIYLQRTEPVIGQSQGGEETCFINRKIILTVMIVLNDKSIGP